MSNCPKYCLIFSMVNWRLALALAHYSVRIDWNLFYLLCTYFVSQRRACLGRLRLTNCFATPTHAAFALKVLPLLVNPEYDLEGSINSSQHPRPVEGASPACAIHDCCASGTRAMLWDASGRLIQTGALVYFARGEESLSLEAQICPRHEILLQKLLGALIRLCDVLPGAFYVFKNKFLHLFYLTRFF